MRMIVSRPSSRMGIMSSGLSLALRWTRLPPMQTRQIREAPKKADVADQKPMRRRMAPSVSTAPVKSLNQSGSRHLMKAKW